MSVRNRAAISCHGTPGAISLAICSISAIARGAQALSEAQQLVRVLRDHVRRVQLAVEELASDREMISRASAHPGQRIAERLERLDRLRGARAPARARRASRDRARDRRVHPESSATAPGIIDSAIPMNTASGCGEHRDRSLEKCRERLQSREHGRGALHSVGSGAREEQEDPVHRVP